MMDTSGLTPPQWYGFSDSRTSADQASITTLTSPNHAPGLRHRNPKPRVLMFKHDTRPLAHVAADERVRDMKITPGSNTNGQLLFFHRQRCHGELC